MICFGLACAWIWDILQIFDDIKDIFNLSSNLFVCSVEIDLLNKFYSLNNINYSKVNSFPSINRDIAILVDNKYHTAYAVRDQLGIKPLFYIETAEGIVFSSEVKAFLNIKNLSIDLNFPKLTD